MDAVNSNGTEFPVSVWMKKIGSDGEHRIIVVIEPVARHSAKFGLDHEVKRTQFHSLLSIEDLICQYNYIDKRNQRTCQT